MTDLIVFFYYSCPLYYFMLYRGYGGAAFTWWFYLLLLRDIQLIPTLYFLKTAKYQIVLQENGRGG